MPLCQEIHYMSNSKRLYKKPEGQRTLLNRRFLLVLASRNHTFLSMRAEKGGLM